MPEETKEVSVQEVYKTLTDFITETRTSFSTQTIDGNTHFELLEKINTNLMTLTSKVENLSSNINKTANLVHVDSKNVIKHTDEIKDRLESKKVIVKEILHFSVKLWLKNKFIHLLKRE